MGVFRTRYVTEVLPGHLAVMAVFWLYMLTLAPTVTFWDSGELCWAAMELGVPHHPGYPLYMNVAKAATLLPLGNVAFRLAFLSAACASMGAFVLYSSLVRFAGGAFGSPWAAAALACAFGMSPLVWPQAVVAEVYGLQLLLLAATLHMYSRYVGGGRMSFLLGACFMFGLSLANHHSTFFLVPAAALAVLTDRRARTSPSVLAAGGFFVALGLSVNLYLPVRASVWPAINLGEPSTLEGLRWLLRWDQYLSGIMRRLADPVDTLGRMAGGMDRVWLALPAALALAGAVYTARRRALLAVLLSACVISASGIGFLMSRDTLMGGMGLHTKFYMPAVLFGIAALFVWLGDRFAPPARGAAAVFLSVIALGISLMVASVHYNYEQYDNIDNYYAEDFARNTLKSVGEREILFSWGDNAVFPAWYLQGVERYREDVLLVYTPIMTNRWYFRKVRRELKARYGIGSLRPGRIRYPADNIKKVVMAVGGEKRVSYDYTTMLNLNYGWTSSTPVGMVWKRGRDPDAMPNDALWKRFSIRVDDPAKVSKSLVSEDVFWVYGFQAFWWGEKSVAAGKHNEANSAYYKALFYGYNPDLVEVRLGRE